VYPKKAQEQNIKDREQSLKEKTTAAGNLIVPKKLSAHSAKNDSSSVRSRLRSLMPRSFSSFARVDVESKSASQTGGELDTTVSTEIEMVGTDGAAAGPAKSVKSSFKTMERIEDMEEDENDGLDNHSKELAAIQSQAVQEFGFQNYARPGSSKRPPINNRPTSGHSNLSAESNHSSSHKEATMAPFHTPNSSSAKSARDESKGSHHNIHGHLYSQSQHSQHSGRSRTNSDDRSSPAEERGRALSHEQAALLMDATNKLYTSPHSSRPHSMRSSNTKSPTFDTPTQMARKARHRADTDGEGSVASHHSSEKDNVLASAFANGGAGKYVQFEDDVLMLNMETPNLRGRKGMAIPTEQNGNSSGKLTAPNTDTNTTVTSGEKETDGGRRAGASDFTSNFEDRPAPSRSSRWSVADMEEANFMPDTRPRGGSTLSESDASRVEAFVPMNRKTFT
jgi:hypothetical protein